MGCSHPEIRTTGVSKLFGDRWEVRARSGGRGMTSNDCLERRRAVCLSVGAVLALFFGSSLPALSEQVPAEPAYDRSPVEAPLEVLYRMDQNEDGRVEIHEIPAGAELFVIRLATEADVDPLEPIPLKEFSTSWLKHAFENRTPVPGGEGSGTESDVGGESKPTDSIVDWEKLSRYTLAISSVRGVMGIDPHLETLARMDRNRNGMLQATEIPDQAEDYVRQLLREDGFNLSRPVSLATLARARRIRRQVQEDGPRKEAKSRAVDSSQNKRLAENLMRLYDSNRDGHLDKSEWNRLNPAWDRADRNRDRHLTVSEIAYQLASIQEGRKHAVSAAPKTQSRGLPSFSVRDNNRDGPIQPAESRSSKRGISPEGG